MATGLLDRVVRYVRARGAADALFFLASSLIRLIRGLLHGYWLVFLGKGVTIRARRQVHIGKFTRIEDYAELDGFGDTGLRLGAYCKVGKFSILRVPPVPHQRGAGILIGDHSTFAEFCFIGGAALVRIGVHNAIGAYVSIHPQDHLPVTEGGEVRTRSQGIVIGDHNWLGAKATILDGTVIGDRAIVAANAAAKGEFGSDVLIAGVPAKVKRSLVTDNPMATPKRNS